MTTPYNTQTQGEWYQFDPNVHYYYDEQNQLHYYDPNTNLEYDYQPQYQQPVQQHNPYYNTQQPYSTVSTPQQQPYSTISTPQQQQQPTQVYSSKSTPQQVSSHVYTAASTPQSYTPMPIQQQHQHLDTVFNDISRQGTPDVMLPCPDPTCNGENKPSSKFCEECGRPLGAVSRSATPGVTTSTTSMTSLTRALSNHQIRETEHYYSQPQDVAAYQRNSLPPPQRPPTAPIYSTSHHDSAAYDPSRRHFYYDNNKVQSMQDLYSLQQRETYYAQPPAVDPLGRARGCPIVSFGFGGKMLVSFPRAVANYYASTVKPQPGPIKIKSIKEYTERSVLPTFFPGPLLLDPKVGIKQKKKDIGVYLNTMVDEFEKQKASVVYQSLDFYQLESKILLYQVLKVMVETDGTINDKDKMDEAILNVIRPQIKNADDGHFTLPAYSGQENGNNNADISDHVLSKIEEYLLKGDRKGAVEYAVREDLWAHALIISSCVDKELWQRVIQNFVEREMNCTPEMKLNRTFHPIAGNSQPLRVIYSLFSGAGAVAMKEFLKVDLQFVNTPYGQNTITPKVDYTQLIKWRETLAIILANRTGRDLEALTAFGDIMRDQGWIEAAHICYLLSPQNSIHSGVDTLNVRFTLIGDRSMSLESIRLSEIFEFSQSLRTSPPACLPFLQGYKLAHAWMLADYGHVDVAHRYFSAIDQSIKSYTKGSPYLHTQLINQVETFGLFLENASGKRNGIDPGSWLKPKFQKNPLSSLWGSLEGSLTKFVSGEEVPVQEPPPRKSTEIMSSYL